MGRPDITDVIELLQTAGYRTGRAFPGKRMPAIQVPAVTVAVQKDEEKQQLLAVTVLCPENMGGGQCEDAALGITEVLRQRGYICTQEHCQYDGRGDRFSVRILALWEDAPADDPYAVSMGLGPMNYVDGFSVEQKKDLLPVYSFGQSAPVDFLSEAGGWTFTLEEFFPGKTEQPQEPVEPFEMVVRRGAVGEIFGDCRWLSDSRTHTREGMKVVRKGTAQTRSVHIYE